MALTILATIAVVFMLRELQEVLIPIVLAVLLAYTLAPLVTWLSRFAPRVVATVAVLALLVGGLGLTAYRLQDDFASVIAEMPDAARRLRVAVRESQRNGEGTLGSLRRTADELDRAVRTATGESEARPQPPSPVTPSNARDYFRQASLIAGQITTVFFLTFFLLVSEGLYKQKLLAMAGPRLEKRRMTLKIIDAIGSQMGRFLMVMAFTSSIVAVATWATLAWLGVQQAVVWGLVAGLFNTIPFFGPVIVTALLGTVAFAQFGSLTEAAFIAGISLLVTTLEGYLLTPILMSRASRINALTVFVSIVFWSWLWGIAGTLLAVPIMMVIKTICDHIEGWRRIGELMGEYEEPRARSSVAG